MLELCELWYVDIDYLVCLCIWVVGIVGVYLFWIDDYEYVVVDVCVCCIVYVCVCVVDDCVY